MRAYLIDEALALRLRVERANAQSDRSGRNGHHYANEAEMTDWATAEAAE